MGSMDDEDIEDAYGNVASDQKLNNAILVIKTEHDSRQIIKTEQDV